LQSHEYMGVIATAALLDYNEILRKVAKLQSHEYMGVIATSYEACKRNHRRWRKSCNPMSIWELLLLERIQYVEKALKDPKLQSHEYMGVVAT